jgi:hypothetical protein
LVFNGLLLVKYACVGRSKGCCQRGGGHSEDVVVKAVYDGCLHIDFVGGRAAAAAAAASAGKNSAAEP